MKTIQISRNITDIMRLECVIACRKLTTGAIVYLVRHRRNKVTAAYEGDWLVEEYPGFWLIMEDEQYQKKYGTV